MDRKGGAKAEPTQRARPPLLAAKAGEEEHRHFPRVASELRFELWREEGGRRTFSASLRSSNLSVSGAFLDSTFFLPLGTELQLRFALDPETEAVVARGVIVREERGTERTGFGIRFVEFFNQTEVSLAKLFLGARLQAFAEDYLDSKRARALPSELDRVVDALAAWELLKATTPNADPWEVR